MKRFVILFDGKYQGEIEGKTPLEAAKKYLGTGLKKYGGKVEREKRAGAGTHFKWGTVKFTLVEKAKSR